MDLVAGDFNGAAWQQMVTAVNPPVLSKKLLPTQTYQCRLAPHRCGAQVQYQVGGLTYVVLSSPRTLVKNGRSVCMKLSQLPTRPSASVQKIKVAIMRCGCTWTLWTTSMLTRHEGNTSNGSSSKKSPLHTRLTRRRADTMMKVIAHFHLCRLCESLCFHKQRV